VLLDIVADAIGRNVGELGGEIGGNASEALLEILRERRQVLPSAVVVANKASKVGDSIESGSTRKPSA
jgi:hypothetical protein